MADEMLYRYSVNQTVSDGVQVAFEISFEGGYISKDHVKVLVIRPDDTFYEPSYSWTGDYQITLAEPVPAGYAVRRYRQTPIDAPLVDFSDQAIINEDTLDMNAKQAVFIAQEYTDAGGAGLAQSAIDAAVQAIAAGEAAQEASVEALSNAGLADEARLAAETAQDATENARDDVLDPLSDMQSAINALTADPENAVSEIFIPVTMMSALLSAPSTEAAPTLVTTARLKYWQLPKIAGQAKLETTLRVPSHWTGCTVQFVMANPNSFAGDVQLAVSAYSHADGEDLSITPPNTLGQAASVSSAAFVQFTRPAFTGTLPLDASKVVTLTFARIANGSFDTLGAEIYLLGVRLIQA